MQKVLAVFLVSLLLFPPMSFAQELKVNEGLTIGQGAAATVRPGTLRESAIRQARLAAAHDTTQDSQSPAPANRPSIGSDLGKGALWGAGIGAGAGFAVGLTCGERQYECGGVPALYALGGAMVGGVYGLIVGLVVHALR